MNNVHEDQPVVFQTRWALSYLRGPLTREQIQTLMAPQKQAKAVPSPEPRPWHRPRRDDGRAPTATATTGRDAPASSSSRPLALPRPAAVPSCRRTCPSSSSPPGTLATRARRSSTAPRSLGVARVHYADKKSGIDSWETLGLIRPIGEEIPTDVWHGAEVHADHVPELEKTARAGRQFRPPAAPLSRAKSMPSTTRP